MSSSTLLALLGPPPARGRADWLAARLASLAAEGRLAPGARIPSERELAQGLGLSRGTVVRGLDAARDRGILAARRGSGRTVRGPSAAGPVEALTARAAPLAPGAVDLRATVLPPHPRLAAEAAEVAAHLTEDPAWGSAPADGIAALVEQICAHYARRGLPTSPRQVVVTTGAVSALHLALLATTGTGDRVGTENPGYPNSARVITTGRRRVVPIDVLPDHAGAIADAVGSGALAAAILTPDFHNPTGALVGGEARLHLLRAAARTGTPLIIDETLVGMNWRGAAMPPPVAGGGARTLLVGSLSKSLWAGLRIGWVRTSEEDADALAHLRLGVDLGAPLFEQQLAARLLAAGRADGADGVPHCREHIERSYTAVTSQLAEKLPHWRWRPPAGGLSLWAEGTRLEARDLVARAARSGIALSPGALFSPTGAGWSHAVRLPFSGREDELRRAMEVLAELDR
ncbi:PLP-dependent aminotransferase family protein [Brachybacterium sp. YJGR34]|uniref:aminotransferase-like domain-containing protein n=1 Tax=Brachybacterium sp. YJGR34 TaxID=2059911 RepID=UPI001E3B6053|nr:PLP-dependent aminotransferase family protein [Brachybacterium sp. YJGR34]